MKDERKMYVVYEYVGGEKKGQRYIGDSSQHDEIKGEFKGYLIRRFDKLPNHEMALRLKNKTSIERSGFLGRLLEGLASI